MIQEPYTGYRLRSNSHSVFRLVCSLLRSSYNSNNVEFTVINEIIVNLWEGTSEIPSAMRMAGGRAGTATSLVDSLYH